MVVGVAVEQTPYDSGKLLTKLLPAFSKLWRQALAGEPGRSALSENPDL